MAEASTATTSLSDLCECHDCGLFQQLPAMRPGQVATCERCDATLRRRRPHSFAITGALMITGLALFSVIVTQPLLGIRVVGRQITTTLPTLPFSFEQFSMPELTLVVLGVTVIAPLLKLLLTGGVLLGLRTNASASTLAGMARVRAWLTPWAMTEVFLLGIFVAYTRLTGYAAVQIGAALYAMGGLMLVMVAADAWLDEHGMWEAIAMRRGATRAGSEEGQPIGCDTCGQVSAGEPGDLCPVCESRLRIRKTEPVIRCWALLLAAAALYIPSNILPVMSIIRLNRQTTATILGGVQELIAAKMWPLALIVFTASVAVPVIKLVLLGYMLISTQRRSNAHLRRRTKLYRLVDVIGRWSMIDVFMISILTALVRMGILASVVPEPGAICFCGVVILTMLAAASFDPRVMWDAAEAPSEAPAPTSVVQAEAAA